MAKSWAYDQSLKRPHRVMLGHKVRAAEIVEIADWLMERTDLEGTFMYELGEDRTLYTFSDERTAFEFKMKFG